MTSQLSKEEYLKKYLGGDKKKKRVKILKGKGTRVVDDDAAMPSAAGDSELADVLLGTAEEKPQVVGDVTAASAAAAAKKRWKTLDDCDLEELESQRRLLSESLKLLEQSGGVAVEGEQTVRRRHDSSDSGSASNSAGSSSGSSDADSDASSHRRRRRRDGKRRSRRSSDASPPRRKPPAAAVEAGGIWPDSDASPPRKRVAGETAAAPLRRENGVATAGGEKRPDSDESPPRSWKRTRPERTLDGKRAGLQDITALRAENKTAKLRELNNMKEMDESLSGRHADTKVRGRKLEQARERAREDEKARERKKKYDVWSKGVKQTEQQQARLVDHLKEMSKPMARYADDDDLEHQLKARPRADDPMAAFIQRKQDKQLVGKKVRPRYDKSDPPPNRYSIWPGYRWDGVDRSNGFERQYFLRKNAKKARDSDAYKWSTEDM